MSVTYWRSNLLKKWLTKEECEETRGEMVESQWRMLFLRKIQWSRILQIILKHKFTVIRVYQSTVAESGKVNFHNSILKVIYVRLKKENINSHKLCDLFLWVWNINSFSRKFYDNGMCYWLEAEEQTPRDASSVSF